MSAKPSACVVCGHIQSHVQDTGCRERNKTTNQKRQVHLAVHASCGFRYIARFMTDGTVLEETVSYPRHSKTGVKGNQSTLIHTANLLTKISNVGSMRREADKQKIVEVEQAPELITGATAENSSLTSFYEYKYFAHIHFCIRSEYLTPKEAR